LLLKILTVLVTCTFCTVAYPQALPPVDATASLFFIPDKANCNDPNLECDAEAADEFAFDKSPWGPSFKNTTQRQQEPSAAKKKTKLSP
jgi:hypothetical protein